jgi:GWxTD domain-containing protein
MAILSRRASLLLVAIAPLAACTSWQRVNDSTAPNPEATLTQLFNPGPLYARLGRLVSSGQIAFIGSVATLPGAGDSTRVLVGVSLANRAFTFERVGDRYEAPYRIEYTLTRPDAPPRTVRQESTLRVATLQESLRTDESLLLQQEIDVAPGTYQLTVRVTDPRGNQVGTVERQVVARPFAAGTVSAPMLTYQAEGRGARGDSLKVVMNSRGAIAYGGDTLMVYLEGVGFTQPTTVPVEVRDERDSVISRTALRFTGAREIESQVIRVAPDSAPLGQLQVIVQAPDTVRTVSALVSFSGNWVVTNFDDLLSLLRYFGEDTRLQQMNDAPMQDRIELWRDFYRRTDPNRQTPENEAIDAYFARVAIANLRFRDEGIPGWRTDRGEVFISFGNPDEAFDAAPLNQGRYVRWAYNDLRLVVFFQDVTGFGRFRMTPPSRAEFERVRRRELRPTQ